MIYEYNGTEYELPDSISDDEAMRRIKADFGESQPAPKIGNVFNAVPAIAGRIGNMFSGLATGVEESNQMPLGRSLAHDLATSGRFFGNAMALPFTAGYDVINSASPRTGQRISNFGNWLFQPNQPNNKIPMSVYPGMTGQGSIGTQQGSPDALQGMQNFGQQHPALSDIGSFAANAVGGGVLRKASGEMASAIGKPLSELSKYPAAPLAKPMKEYAKIIEARVLKPTKKDFDDGFDLDYTLKNNLGGDLKQTQGKVDDKFTYLTGQLNTKLKGTDAKLDIQDPWEATKKDIIENNLGGYGQNSLIQKAVEYLDNENKLLSGGTSMNLVDATKVKRLIGKMGSWYTDSKGGAHVDPNANALGFVANKYYGNLKTAIEKASPEGVKEINAEIAKLIPIDRAVERRIPVAMRNEAIPLKHFMAFTGAIASGNPAHAAGLVGLVGAHAISKSGKAAQKLYNIGESIENRKSISDLFGNQKGFAGVNDVGIFNRSVINQAAFDKMMGKQLDPVMDAYLKSPKTIADMRTSLERLNPTDRSDMIQRLQQIYGDDWKKYAPLFGALGAGIAIPAGALTISEMAKRRK